MWVLMVQTMQVQMVGYGGKCVNIWWCVSGYNGEWGMQMDDYGEEG